MLEDYARRNGFPNPTHFTDDGISETHFDRASFNAMMEEVEAGHVDSKHFVRKSSSIRRKLLRRCKSSWCFRSIVSVTVKIPTCFLCDFCMFYTLSLIAFWILRYRLCPFCRFLLCSFLLYLILTICYNFSIPEHRGFKNALAWKSQDWHDKRSVTGRPVFDFVYNY